MNKSQHSLARATKTFSHRGRIAASIAALALAGGSVAVFASGASASTGGNYYSQYASGYKVTGTNTQFRYATATTYLRNDLNFSSSYQPFVEIYNNSVSAEVELIPTTINGTPTNTYNPNADLGGMNIPEADIHWTQNTVYPTTSPCFGNTDTRGCFSAGETITFTVYYDQYTHDVRMTAVDRANGNGYSAYGNIGSAQLLTTAGIGTLWLANFNGGTYTPPSQVTKLESFTGASLTSYAGRSGGLQTWTAHRDIMVGNTTTDTPVEAAPTSLSNSGTAFTNYLLP
jgi:hypothetical protein